MKEIVIFSGTTEGRALSEMLSKEQIHHIVCVASDYGKDMMQENPFAEVHVGRMDAGEMEGFLKGHGMCIGEGDHGQNQPEGIVVDATHPYATEVTANIKSATATLGIRYIRVGRGVESGLPDDALRYSDIAECAKSMDKMDGNILLTTGSKELGTYCVNVSEDKKKRTYVRVLPSIQSLKLCEDNGIEQDHVIAMHGPFSKGLNAELIRQYDIKHLITKESGAAGGFAEKRDAATTTGARLHVIERPADTEGVSVEEAFRMITGKAVPKPNTSMQISLIGIGMGSEDSLSLSAFKTLRDCDMVFGAKRLLKEVSCIKKHEMYLARDIIPILEKEMPRKVAIVFSGDTGFYSGSKKMIAELKKWKDDIDLKVFPGISAVSYLAAKLGESYDDACLFSIHGKNSDQDICALTDKVMYQEKVFTLLSGTEDIPRIAKRLMDIGITGKISVGINLSYDNEIIKELSFEEAKAFKGEGIACALIYNASPERRVIINMRRDSEFIRSKVPMTKECIRHESIIRLGLREGDVFYDIGGGTGSVAIEAALLHPGLKVVTIEKKQEAAELIRKNIDELKAHNVTVIEGEAEAVLHDLEKPDCVFIGGSGGKLREIIDILRSKGERIRYVINAVSLETISEVKEVISRYAPKDEEAIMMSVSDVQKVGSYHMLQGQNPIWIFSFTI